MTTASFNGNGNGRKYRILVVGALGAIGSLMAELVADHPDLELGAVTARDSGNADSPVGKKLYEIYPEHRIDIEVQDLDGIEVSNFDAALLAVPPEPAAELARTLLTAGVKVVDSCGAFRFQDIRAYEDRYGPHGAPELIAGAVYGLPELHREDLSGATLVGNPGCYPTASVLALAPLAKAGLIGDVVIDAKSGVSGAGKRGESAPAFVGTHENMRPYGIPGHKHEPEIREQLSLLSYEGSMSFVPHLVPLDQGELVSCYVKLGRELDPQDLEGLYREAYASEQFVELAPEPPTARDVQRTNLCRIYPVMDRDRERVFVFATLDNLWKGGASQAIQNLNLVLGLPEGAGLDRNVAVERRRTAAAGERALDRSAVSA